MCRCLPPRCCICMTATGSTSPQATERSAACRSGRRQLAGEHAGDPLRHRRGSAGRFKRAGAAEYGGSVMIRGLVDFALNNRWLVVGASDHALRLGSRLLPQPSRRSLPRRRQQLRPGHHAVARPRRRRGRAAGHHADRDPDGRHSAHDPSAVHLARRPLQRHHDLRRRLRQQGQSRAGLPAPRPGHPSRRPAAPDGHRLESGRPDLLVHPALHQSRLRQHGAQVACRTGSSRKSSSPSPASSTSPASAA